MYRPVVAEQASRSRISRLAGLFCGRTSGQSESLLGNGRAAAKIIFMEQYWGSSGGKRSNLLQIKYLRKV